MPTYEYVCDACDHEFELLQRMSDPAVRKCPKCKKLKVRRIISGGAGVIFKGSGFYETDYKQKRGGSGGGSRRESESSSATSDAKPASDAKGADTKSESKSDSSSGTKPESKPAPKSDAKPSSGGSKGSAKKKDS